MNHRLLFVTLATLLSVSLAPAAFAAPDSETAAAFGVIQKGYISAWNRADAAAIGANYVADGDFINPTGFHARGPKEIQAFYARAFAAGYAGSTATFTLRATRKIAPGVVVIDGEWTIKGAHKPTGEAIPLEAGIATAVVVKTPAGWRASALREQESATKITP